MLAVSGAACVEKVEVDQATAGTASDLAGGSATDADSVVSRFAGQEMSFGTIPDEPTAATGEPIVVGMINQENTPLGSFPELRLGAEAAFRFVNEELGGVGGRPIEFRPCITTFSPEKSRACAQELVDAGAVAVVGGIDITSNGSIPVLEQNGLPYVGGIPVNFDEMTSPVSFQFSGGSPGAFVAFAWHAASEVGARKVTLVYPDYAPIAVSADYAEGVLRSLGVTDIARVPYPITTTDFLPVVTKAAEGDPDAIIVGAADAACAPTMKTAHDLGVEATLYLVGACLAPSIAAEVGPEAIAGRIFNVEGPVTGSEPEADLYAAVVTKYGDPQLNAGSASTVSFRAAMNLYAALDALGPDDLSPEAVLAEMRRAVDRPSFNGHPYTCDGRQLPDLPAMCAPQQMLAGRDGDTIVALSDWIDVPALVEDSA
jgi:branched-chain amino acid transport system substrate-binding protein